MNSNKYRFISGKLKFNIPGKTPEEIHIEKEDRTKIENLRQNDVFSIKTILYDAELFLVLNNNNEKIRAQSLKRNFSSEEILKYPQIRNSNYMFVGVYEPWWKRIFGKQIKLLY